MIWRSIINASTSSVRPRAHDWYNIIRLTYYLFSDKSNKEHNKISIVMAFVLTNLNHHSMKLIWCKFWVFHKRNWTQMVWYIMSPYPEASPQIARHRVMSNLLKRKALQWHWSDLYILLGSSMADRLQCPTCVSIVPVLKIRTIWYTRGL